MGEHDDIDHSGLTGVPGSNPQFTTIELGHASDTTLSRASAGVVAVEGTNLVKAGAATSSGITMATARLLGRTTASSGAIEEITVGSGLSLSAGSLTATGAGAVTMISDDLKGSAAANFDFTSIAGSYKHLRIVLMGRSSTAAVNDTVRIQFNNDSGSNYDHYSVGWGSATAFTPAGDAYGEASGRCIQITGDSATAGDVGSGTIELPDYASTTFNKSSHGTGMAAMGRSAGGMRLDQFGVSWRSTAAITRVTLILQSGANFMTGSRATLYGIS